MAFNGTWKIEKNENYEKFMEAMGKPYFFECLLKAGYHYGGIQT